MSVNGVRQLWKLELRLNPKHGAAAGAKAFLKTEASLFAKLNPAVRFVAKRATAARPVMIGHYLNGTTQSIPLSTKSSIECFETANTLRDRTGREHESLQINSSTITEFPSVQGPWYPGMFQDTKPVATSAIHQVFKAR